MPTSRPPITAADHSMNAPSNDYGVEWYRDITTLVKNIARSYKRDPRDELSDLVQEVALRAWRAMSTTKTRNPESYVALIVHNLLKDRREYWNAAKRSQPTVPLSV